MQRLLPAGAGKQGWRGPCQAADLARPPLQVIVEKAERSRHPRHRQEEVRALQPASLAAGRRPRGGGPSALHPLCRYLVPADLTVGQFVYVIRKRIKVSPEKAIFMFVKNVLPPTGGSAFLLRCLHATQVPLRGGGLSPALAAAALMSDVYEDHKDDDGFLYITYSGGEHLWPALVIRCRPRAPAP